MANTIWDRYGGYSFVAKAVDDFYARVLLSQSLVGYFEKIDMEQLISHQIETIGAVMGGPLQSGCRSPAPRPRAPENQE